jgi:protein-L-isoaspartate(D-aspartate) O-methyltransferase
MAEAASIRPGAHVLEVGTGSGYGAAVLARLAGHVVTIERHAELAERAAAVLRELGFDNVEVVTGDGTLGWPDGAPYDAVVVTAAAQEVPPPLLDQLADDGRLVIPVGRWGRSQELVCLHRRGEDIDEVDLGGVAFVPLVPDHDGD